jgi:hypothetical protein
MNADLAKVGICNITARADIRNNAAHWGIVMLAWAK